MQRKCPLWSINERDVMTGVTPFCYEFIFIFNPVTAQMSSNDDKVIGASLSEPHTDRDNAVMYLVSCPAPFLRPLRKGAGQQLANSWLCDVMMTRTISRT